MMDIQAWLNDTVEAEAPEVPVQTAACNFFSRPEQPKPVFQEKRAQKRCRSDSSLLVPQSHSQIVPPHEPDTPTEYDPAGSVGDEPSSERYVRRPRRKTRPERYEPKQNRGRGKYVHQSRKDESKKTRRTSRCKKEEKVEGGVGQSFHAKNVSRDRLTVRATGHAVVCTDTDDWMVAEAEGAAGYLQQGQGICGRPGPWA
jgi:hypothetical protein